MFVSVCIPCGPKCFRCMLEILSMPTAEEFFSCLMIRAMSTVVASIMV